MPQVLCNALKDQHKKREGTSRLAVPSLPSKDGGYLLSHCSQYHRRGEA